MKIFTRTGMAIAAVLYFAIIWIGCNKASLKDENLSGTPISLSGLDNSVTVTSVPTLCGPTLVKNYLKNTTTYGNIHVGNDASDYYITINSNAGWMINDIKLYAGPEAGIPLNGGGLPLFNSYPVQASFSSPYISTWSLKVPIADMGNSFTVSARVSFINSTTGQALWSEGTLYTNGASRFDYEFQPCIIDEGCAYGQGYWFGNGNLSWPDVNGVNGGNITIGGEFYTRDEARDIWWANNGACPGIPNAKKAFAFVAAIKLSDSNVIGNTGLWTDLATVDAWLESLERLTPDNICDHPDAPSDVMDAVARLGDWMDAHNCE